MLLVLVGLVASKDRKYEYLPAGKTDIYSISNSFTTIKILSEHNLITTLFYNGNQTCIGVDCTFLINTNFYNCELHISTDVDNHYIIDKNSTTFVQLIFVIVGVILLSIITCAMYVVILEVKRVERNKKLIEMDKI